MDAITAFIIVGRSHTFHGGIIPNYILSLYENDQPAWVLKYFPNKIRESSTSRGFEEVI